MHQSASITVGSISLKLTNVSAVALFKRGTISSRTAVCLTLTTVTRSTFGRWLVSWLQTLQRLGLPMPLGVKGELGGCLFGPWVWEWGAGAPCLGSGLCSLLNVARLVLA